MKIALVGPPKSGKTKYAKALKEEGYLVVDNIPQKFSRATGLAVGFDVGYRVDHALNGLRFAEYYKAAAKTDKFVMTTTFLDSLAYGHIGFESREYDLLIEQGGNPEIVLGESEKYPNFIGVLLLTQFFRNTWLFDKTIVLTPKNLDPESESAKLLFHQKLILESNGIEYELAGVDGATVGPSEGEREVQ